MKSWTPHGGDGIKDNAAAQWLAGLLLPAALLVHTAYCWACGAVFCLKREAGIKQDSIGWAEDEVSFTLWVSLQLAVAIGCFSWFWLANQSAGERYAEAGVLVACVVLICGVLLAIFYAVA